MWTSLFSIPTAYFPHFAQSFPPRLFLTFFRFFYYLALFFSLFLLLFLSLTLFFFILLFLSVFFFISLSVYMRTRPVFGNRECARRKLAPFSGHAQNASLGNVPQPYTCLPLKDIKQTNNCPTPKKFAPHCRRTWLDLISSCFDQIFFLSQNALFSLSKKWKRKEKKSRKWHSSPCLLKCVIFVHSICASLGTQGTATSRVQHPSPPRFLWIHTARWKPATLGRALGLLAPTARLQSCSPAHFI